MNRSFAAAVAALATAAAAPAFAEGWYAGLSLGQGKVNVSAAEVGLSSGSLDDNDLTWGARVGYGFSRHLGVEAAYYDLGKYQFNGAFGRLPASGEAKVKSYNVAAVGTLPFGYNDVFGAYGKVGYARTRVSASANVAGFQGSSKEWDNEAMYGLGLKWNPDRQWGLFAEWNRLHDTQLENWMVGATVRF